MGGADIRHSKAHVPFPHANEGEADCALLKIMLARMFEVAWPMQQSLRMSMYYAPDFQVWKLIWELRN